MENVPHVVWKSSVLMDELMEGEGKLGEGLRGKETFCTSLNFPGRPGLGIIEMGED